MRMVLKKYALLGLVLACAKERAAVPDSVGASAQASNPRAAAAPETQDSSRILTRDSSGVLTHDARRTILFVGTSLTAGLGLDPDSAYPAQIQRLIDKDGLQYEVVNAGYSGERSSGLLRRIDWLMREPHDIVIIETGANDGLNGIPVTAMKDNIGRIIARIRELRPQTRIMLVQMEALPNLGRAYTEGFHDVFPALARQYNITLLPFLLENVAGLRSLNQSDGIHPNEEGERIVTGNVWRALKPHLK